MTSKWLEIWNIWLFQFLLWLCHMIRVEMAQTTCGVTCVTRDLGRVTCCNDLRNIALAIGCLFFFGRRGYHFFCRIAWSSGDESFTITVATAVHLLLSIRNHIGEIFMENFLFHFRFQMVTSCYAFNGSTTVHHHMAIVFGNFTIVTTTSL